MSGFPSLKKPQPHRDDWLLHRRKKLRNRKARVEARRRHRRRFGRPWKHEQNVASDKPEAKAPREIGAEVFLPETMDIEANYSATVRALMKVRLASKRQLRLRYLNFDTIRYISPSAALLLASEVDRWKDSIAGMLRARDANWHPPIKCLLCQMGLFELLGLERPKDQDGAINTTFLPFMRGNVDERTHAGAFAKELRQKIEKVAATEIKKHLLSDGITEAATNVCHHAYRRRGRKKKRYKPWWMSAAVASDTKMITVSFYDHGLTIPGTLPVSEKMERWKHRMGLWNDGQRIRAAMTLGRSATGKSGRGKGLKNFLELVAGHGVSRLTIISRGGKLVVENTGNQKLSYRSELLETHLPGTLIEWQFVPNTATNDLTNAHLDR